MTLHYVTELCTFGGGAAVFYLNAICVLIFREKHSGMVSSNDFYLEFCFTHKNKALQHTIHISRK